MNHCELATSSSTTIDELQNGDRLQCSTRMQKFSGELLLVDRREGIFVLRERKGNERQFNIHFVRFAELQSLKKLSSPPSNFDGICHVPTDSPATARDRLVKAEQRLSQLWVDKTPSEAAKRTFIELKRIFDDVVWDGESIKVLKCVVVTAPFDENGVECIDSRASSVGTLARVKKILARRSSPSSSGCCSVSSASSRTVLPPPLPQHCVSVSSSSSSPSTLFQPVDKTTASAVCESDTLRPPSSSVVADLFLDASPQSEVPKALARTVSPLLSSQCFSSSEELEMVTPPTID
ncbi:hypothetical protein niasHT_027595 [Heterodera trifolii]|uniref:AD domain-containing protein n=1 Tax=Heterodera trifolii TaxID=157864 RepID=A0ABD2K5N7_9BILA